MNHEHLLSYRQTAVNSLAVIGFIALLGLGVFGAIYSARYVPSIVNRVGGAAVYIGSLFNPTSAPTDLAVVPNASSTIITFGTPSATTTLPTAADVVSVPQATPTPPKVTTPAPRPAPVLVRVPATTTPALYGLPDLSIKATAIGYLNANSIDSFVESAKVPEGKRPAIKFTIANTGTNTAAPWRFSAKIPTRTSFTYKSDLQQGLLPGDSIDYVFGFDRAKSGSQPIEIVADYDSKISEANESNNTLTLTFTIE